MIVLPTFHLPFGFSGAFPQSARLPAIDKSSPQKPPDHFREENSIV
jgi:hypothetical protein